MRATVYLVNDLFHELSQNGHIFCGLQFRTQVTYRGSWESAACGPFARLPSEGASRADHEGRDIESQLVPVSRSTLELQRVLHENGALPKLAHAASDELVFIADLPPLGYATYKVSKSVTPSDDTRSVAFVSDRVDWSDRPEWTADANDGDRIRISNGGLHAEYCSRSGRMTSLKTRYAAG